MIKNALLLIMTFVFIQPAFANTIDSVFKTQTIQSFELRESILNRLLLSYPCADHFGITEIETTVKANEFDQGKTDYFYESTFKIKAHFDKYHPSSVRVVVRSALYYGQNPKVDWTEIIEVKSTSKLSCE